MPLHTAGYILAHIKFPIQGHMAPGEPIPQCNWNFQRLTTLPDSGKAYYVAAVWSRQLAYACELLCVEL